ncbi:MAG: excinuclease ABC subunit UvrC [Candidatus Aminicenantes bacterium]|nr:excinuclease ABC subunit UvrC [Candidatus Aminicenantes bacterium]
MIKSKKDIPEKPGVYLFKSKKKILYIGKAKNLSKRVGQYFQEKSNLIIENLLERARDIEYIVTDDEKDALHLEYNLIHTYLPPFNIKLKDDKSFPCIEITTAHDYPGVYFNRQVKRENFYIGPITHSGRTRGLIDIVSRLFKIRACSDSVFKRGRLCLYFYIDRCSGPCAGRIDAAAYGEDAAAAVEFLKGNKSGILKKLKQRMKLKAGQLEFEAAQQIKEDIELIEQFTLDSYISSVRRNDYDVAAVYHEDRDDCFIILFSVLQGRVKRREFFNFSAFSTRPEDILKDFLISFYRRENIPPQVLVPFFPADKEYIEDLFSQLVKKKVTIKIPQRGDKKRMFDLTIKNLNLYVSRNRFSVVGGKVKEALKLKNFPEKIEGFDISHFAERERVGAAVVFLQGKPDRKGYRSYIIKAAAPGDTAALQEVLRRRFKKKENFPDLLLIDGGRAQLSAARQVKQELGITADVVSIAKGEERIYLEHGGSVVFPRGSAQRFLFQEIRDEVHRRAVTHHKKRRQKLN